MRMAGKGIKKVSGYGYGDHYIHIRIQPPKDLTEKQRALLQAFAESEENTPGTINGLTYTQKGGKVVIEDPDGLVGEIRELLSDDKESNKNKAQQLKSSPPEASSDAPKETPPSEPPSENPTKVPPQEETRNTLGFSPYVLGVFISILGCIYGDSEKADF